MAGGKIARDQAPAMIEKLRKKQRELRAHGRDEDAAKIGTQLVELESRYSNVQRTIGQIAALEWLNGLLMCGVRVAEGEFVERFSTAMEFQNNAVACDSWPRTPAERLRYMLLAGRRMCAELGELTYGGLSIYVNKLYNAAQGEGINGKRVDPSMFIRQLWSCLNWARSGGNQFEITPDLAAALLLTEAPTLTPEEAKFPYATLAFTLPRGAVPFIVPADGGGTRAEWADTLWIEARDNGDLLWIVRWRTVEVHAVLAADLSWKIAEDEYATSEEKNTPDDEVSFAAALRLVRNFLLWLDAEGGVKAHKPEIVPPKLVEKRRRSGEEWPRRWLFGKEVKIGPELRRAAAEQSLGRSRHSVEGWKLRARFTVRGHWRNQAHGPGRVHHRRQWIAPFWKGPVEREAWAHIYKPAETT